MRVRRSPRRHVAPTSDVLALVSAIVQASEAELVPILTGFSKWCYPRGDLHTWAPVLDRFDALLATIVEAYDLSRPQSVPFSPETRVLLLEILRVERMLLESCTSRKLFSSFDRMADLLFTSDTAVLRAALYVLMRPFQQYTSQTPLETGLGVKITQRLLALAKGWDHISASGIDVITAASRPALEVSEEARRVNMTFYPSSRTRIAPKRAASSVAHRSPGGTGSTSVSETAITLDLGVITPLNVPDPLKHLRELETISKMLVCLSLDNLDLRRERLAIRLLSLATVLYFMPEEAAQSAVFLSEPDLISQLADALRAFRSTGYEITAAVLLALDACAHHRGRMTEVFTLVSGSASRGAITTFLRTIVGELNAGVELSVDLVDASFALVSFVISVSPFGSMLVGSGLLSILLDILQVQGQHRDNYIPRAVGLIEAAIYANQQGLSMFSGIGGVTTLVGRIKSEIDALPTTEHPEQGEFLSEDNSKFTVTQPLRSMMRAIHRLMQASGGTEGLRNLVDSELPKSIMRILDEPTVYGSKVFAMAVNLMATFVYNEPTSLAVLQELHMPEHLFEAIEHYPLRSYEALGAVINALGAVCLNQPGLEMTQSRSVMFKTVVQAILQLVEDDPTTERDSMTYMGSCLDELIRHHPPLRDIVFGAVMESLRSAIQAGADFVPPDDQRAEYFLDAWPDTRVREQNVISTPASTQASFIAKALRLLDGMLRNSLTCTHFINDGGIGLVMSIAELPCFPIRFTSTNLFFTMTRLLKTACDREMVPTVVASLLSLRECLDRCTSLWKADDAQTIWNTMVADESPPTESALEALKDLRSVAIRLTFIDGIIWTLSSSNLRNSTELLHMLGPEGKEASLLPDLGQLHRRCFQAHAAFLPLSNKETPTTGPVTLDALALTENNSRRMNAANYLASRTTITTTKLLKGLARLLLTKRPPESRQKKAIEALATTLAKIAYEHVKVGQQNDISASFDLHLLTFGIVAMIMLDDRLFDGYLTTILFDRFDHFGGTKAVLGIGRAILAEMDSAYSQPADAGQERLVMKKASGARMVVLFCSTLTSPKSVVEAPQTQALLLARSDKSVGPNLLVKLRALCLPVLRQVWDAPWLVRTTPAIRRLAVRSYLAVLAGKSEDPNAVPTIFANVAALAPPNIQPTADPAAVQQLVDMGFARRSAGLALLRARNNVPAATEILLRMPHVFPSDDEPALGANADETDLPQPATVSETQDADENEPHGESGTLGDNSNEVPSEETMDVDADTPQEPDYRKELAQVRSELREAAVTRALEIVDQAEDTIFDIAPALPEDRAGVRLLVDRAVEGMRASPAVEDKVLNTRLHLLAISMASGQRCRLTDEDISTFQSLIEAAPYDRAERPKWLSSFLLVVESVLALVASVKEARLGASPDDTVNGDVSTLASHRKGILAICHQIVAAESSPTDEVLSALRFLAVASRYDVEAATGEEKNLLQLLESVKAPKGSPALVVIYLRHLFESQSTLSDIVRREVRQVLSPASHKVMDITHFVRQMRPIALRNPSIFVAAVVENCQLVDPTPPQSVFHLRARSKNTEPISLDTEDPFLGGEDGISSHQTMKTLLQEIAQMWSAARSALADKKPGRKYETTGTSRTYLANLMAISTELVGSYMLAKQSFLSSLGSMRSQRSERPRSGLSFFIHDFVCHVSLSGDLAVPAPAGQISPTTMCSWSASLLVALCSDIVATSTPEDVPQQLATIRKTVLDAVAKALRESHTNEDPDYRYGRIWALSELISRLLLPPVNPGRKANVEPSMLLAKAMLERNYVSLLTASTAEMDLNYPNIQLVLTSVMRTVEHLSKLSVKWGRVEKPKADAIGPEDTDDLAASEHSSSSDDEDDISMSDEDDAARAMYRNSALRVIGGDISEDETDMEDEEDELDDEDADMEGFDHEMMDDIDEDGDTVSTDDDEDAEGAPGQWTDVPDSLAGSGDEDEDEADGSAAIALEPVLDQQEIWSSEYDLHEDAFTDEDEDEGDEMEGDPGMDLGEEIHEEDEEMDVDDAEEFDEIDALDPLSSAGERSALLGDSPNQGTQWGWEPVAVVENRRERAEPRRISRLIESGSLVPSSNRSNNGPPTHPLLIEPSPPSGTAPRASPNLAGLQDLLSSLANVPGTGAVTVINNLIRHIRHLDPHHVNIDLTQLPSAAGSRSLQIAVNGQSVPLSSVSSPGSTDSSQTSVSLAPKPTILRWQDEIALLPGGLVDPVGDIVMHIVNRLMPAARARAAEQAEKLQQQLAATVAKATTEETAEPAAESTGSAQQPDTGAGATLDGATVDAETGEEASSPADLGDVIMTEVDVAVGEHADAPSVPPLTNPASSPPIEGPAREGEAAVMYEPEPTEIGDPAEATGETSGGDIDEASLARVVVMIHGEEVDITDTGIDLEFLQALPDDMRADVVEQHLREQNRSMSRSAGQQQAANSQISREFLEALPPEIRAEVLMQEALENARRAPPANQQQPPAQLPTEFISALDSELRDVLLQAPSAVRTASHRNRDIPSIVGGANENATTAEPASAANSLTKRPKREAVQLLDKVGVASLVRLLFIPEVVKKGHLSRTLVNLCENSSTRIDLLNLLVGIIYEGNGDILAVDQGFQQMSIRSLATPKSKMTPNPKTVDSPAPVTFSISPNIQTAHIPGFIALRCLDALSNIVNGNTAAVDFFLSEQEVPYASKKTPGRKQKGKDKNVQTKQVPLVLLLSLLERTALLTEPGVLDSITGLLSTVCKSLATIPSVAQEEQAGAPNPEPAGPSSSTANASGPSSGQSASSPQIQAQTSALAEDSTPKRPVIPPQTIRLIVNCLTCGECSSRTFSQTLAVMQSLAVADEEKQVIVNELKRRSKQLVVALEAELDLFRQQSQGMNDSAEDDAIGLLSAPNSNQAQLLRLLKTIDFMHLKRVQTESQGIEISPDEEQVARIFADLDAEPLWVRLGECLSMIEEKTDSDNEATALLPLIEALMVVSKYRSDAKREIRSPSVGLAGAGSDDLFSSFTTTHRRVLNTIVRNNPSLLGGSFSLLIRNTRVLEFDNKRNWFFQKLKKKRDAGTHSGSLHLNIRRQYVFEDSFHALQRRDGDEIKFGKLNIKFYNEDGVDAGGVTREWYSALARQIFDPNFALFEPCAADDRTYQPNKASSINADHLAYFKFVGRVIGKAIYDGRLLDAYFSRAFYKQILGRTVDMRDLESIDPEYHKSLQWMLDNDITGVIDQEFTIEDNQFGEKKVVELKEGGATIPVTEENKEEYIRLVVSYRLQNSIQEQLKAFLDGFYDIVPRNLIEIFEPDQLELLISGITNIDVDELKNATQMSGWKSTDPEVSWFWRALRSMSQEERARFLMFVTSSSRVPLGGFTQLQGASGVQPFQLQKLFGAEGILPQASTCFNLLLLPKYASYEQLRERLLFAITETGGFGKA